MDETLSLKSLPSFNELYVLVRRNLERFTLQAVHIALTCFQYFIATLGSIANFQLRLQLRNITSSVILNDSKLLTKTPKHLVIIINEDVISLTDITDLIVWSFLLGIPCITITDRTGYLEEHSTTLLKLYQERCEKICKKDSLAFGHSSMQFHIGKFDEKVIGNFNVILSSLSSGRRNMVSCIKTLCTDMQHNKELLDSFKADVLDSKLKEYNGSVDDPDLAIIFGPYLSYFGFQPWSMRLTEMICSTTHHNVSYRKFMQALRKFARCEQRFGT